VASRLPAVNQLEKEAAHHVIEARTEQSFGRISEAVDLIGAGDRDRTGDIQLGKLTFCH
jgi:hypothetical protein